MMKDGKATMYEILAYEQSEQGLVSRVKHFKPGLLGQEEKDKSDQYNFVEAGKDRAIFEKQGEKLRILYEKRSDNQFVIARGSLQENKWVFKDLFVFNSVK
jgi:molybdopterin-guanine dinucleotide biosynthesis protein